MTPERAEPDGDLTRMLVHFGGLSFPATVAVMLVSSCVGGFFFQIWMMWMIYRITGSRWGRWWTARWWARALLPMAMVVIVGAVATDVAWLMMLSVVMVMGLLPVALWRFLLGMTRPGTPLHRSVQWPGWVMVAMLAVGGLLGMGPLLVSGDPFVSGPLTVMMAAAVLLVLCGNGLLLLLLRGLTRVWMKGAGKPTAHIQAISELAHAQGMTTSGTERRLTVKAPDLTIEVDFAQAPARILITAPLDDLPLDLSVRARREGDLPGVSMGDPMLGELLLVTADDPEAARRHLSGLHEVLLANLHAWPGSTLSGGMLRVEMTGPPFHPPGQVRPERKPDATDTVAALSDQLDAVRQLIAALRVAPSPVAEPIRRPVSEKLLS
ncbi:MAG: hypothetical protein ACI8RZ_001215 [Myxococcota bacterium]|jgi:hypothetical protein